MKIFGREPVLVFALVAVTLKLAAAYGLDVSDTQQGLIMAFLSLVAAAVNAAVLRDGSLGAALVNLAQGGLALFLAFGLDMSAEQQALWILAVEAAVALWVRQNVTAPVSRLPLEERTVVKG